LKFNLFNSLIVENQTIKIYKKEKSTNHLKNKVQIYSFAKFLKKIVLIKS